MALWKVDGHGTGCEDTCCPKNWLGYNGFCYRHFTFKKSWDDARAYCQDLGGDLASIHSTEEDHILDGYIGGESVSNHILYPKKKGTYC